MSRFFSLSGACPQGMYLTGLSLVTIVKLVYLVTRYCEMTQCGPGTFTINMDVDHVEEVTLLIKSIQHVFIEAMAICLLPNTPYNAREIIAGQSLLTNITEGESNYYFQRIKFGYASSSVSSNFLKN